MAFFAEAWRRLIFLKARLYPFSGLEKNMSAMTGLSSRRIKLSFAAFRRKWNISLSWFGLWGMFGRKRFAKKCCKNSKVESGPYEPGAKKSQNEWFNSVEPKQSGKSLNKRVKPSEVTGSRSEEKQLSASFFVTNEDNCQNFVLQPLVWKLARRCYSWDRVVEENLPFREFLHNSA